MFNSLFWKDTFERVLATMAQVLITLFTVDQFNLLTADWTLVVSATATAGVLALLKALVANAAVDNTVSPASLAHDDRGV